MTMCQFETRRAPARRKAPRPIKLQGHQNQVRFRNVWIQVLKLDKKAAAKEKKSMPAGTTRPLKK